MVILLEDDIDRNSIFDKIYNINKISEYSFRLGIFK